MKFLEKTDNLKKNGLKKQICVIGMDDFNMEKLNSFEEAKEYEYHSILEVDELQHQEKYAMDELMKKAISQIDTLKITPDAIIGYWNFPVTCLTPLLAKKYNLPHLPLQALIKCEHKYLSRLEQKKVIPGIIPDFNVVNPFDDQPFDNVELNFPFWLKPVQSFGSQLGFKVENKNEFDKYISIIQKKIHRFADPFNYVLEKAGIPDTIEGIDGNFCIAEQIIKGKQCTIEGYVHNGEVGFLGVFDSLRYSGQETFFSYEYPSKLDQRIISDLEHISDKLLQSLHYDNSSFNIEYFYDRENENYWLLEINPRISQSHADPFYKVDGTPNHKAMIDVALGKRPEVPTRKGSYKVAAKFYYRVFEDGVVTNIPDKNNLEKIKKFAPDINMKIWVDKGTKLSDMHDQDSYSFKLASVYLGADDKDELYEKKERCFNLLNFKIDPIH